SAQILPLSIATDRHSKRSTLNLYWCSKTRLSHHHSPTSRTYESPLGLPTFNFQQSTSLTAILQSFYPSDNTPYTMSTMGSSPSHPAPQGFRSLLFSLQSDPNNLIAEYELHRKKHTRDTPLSKITGPTPFSLPSRKKKKDG
ncbi:hypothetical protein IFR05_008297, partial [Cadophora sp. M221]